MCHIVCKTLTNAQRMTRYLGRNGISAHVKRLPSELRENNGCGYAVSVHDQKLRQSMDLLREIDMEPIRIYQEGESGGYKELRK